MTQTEVKTLSATVVEGAPEGGGLAQPTTEARPSYVVENGTPYVRFEPNTNNKQLFLYPETTGTYNIIALRPNLLDFFESTQTFTEPAQVEVPHFNQLFLTDRDISAAEKSQVKNEMQSRAVGTGIDIDAGTENSVSGGLKDPYIPGAVGEPLISELSQTWSFRAGSSTSSDGDSWYRSSGGSDWYKADVDVPRGAGYWYFEVELQDPPDFPNLSQAYAIGIAPPGTSIAYGTGGNNNAGDAGRLQYFSNGRKRRNGNYEDYGESYTDGDRIGILYSGNNRTLEAFKNGVSQGVMYSGSAVPTTAVPHFSQYYAPFGRLLRPDTFATIGLPVDVQSWLDT